MATKPNIRNYTSSVPADKSVSMIEKKLVENGATEIMKQYNTDGTIKAIMFRKATNNMPMTFSVPARSERVYEVLLAQRKNRIPKGEAENLRKQAERTAWKNVYEWVDLQMTMIQLEQVDFVETFLPYMLVKENVTVYQMLEDTGFKALANGQ